MGSDFNGDGRDDILWWNRDSGLVSDWLGTANGGFTVNDANALHSVANDWRAVGTGDFNGDGRDDILWRSDMGALSNWLGTATGGFVNNDANAFAQADTSWTVIGTADLNGDGRDDILWQNDNGFLSNWLGTASGGFVVNDANALTQYAPSVHIAGTGDFNGDGRDDLLYRLDSGLVGIIRGTPNGHFDEGFDWDTLYRQAQANWQIVGTGDFNGDGRDDILWRSDTGQVSNWLSSAQETFIVNDANALIQVPTNWRVVATGDYNGDGRDDILWRNSDTGALSNWLGTPSGGFMINDAAAYVVVPTEWFVMPNPSGAGEWDYF